MILDIIANSAGLDRKYLAKVVRTASHRYKTYTIPKKNGGLRLIEHPSKELKFLQSWLVDNVFEHLPVHNAVYSYRRGISIRQHAIAHRSNNYLLRVDFTDFFPSIRAEDIVGLLRRSNTSLPVRLEPRDYGVIAAIVCKNNRLTIGAPSSPALSNAVMFEFDVYWASYARKVKATYTRYADDLYFSTDVPNVLEKLLVDLRKYIGVLKAPRLKVNDQKTTFNSRKRKRIITGLVLSSDNQVSLGRAKKRHVKSLVFRFTQDKLEKSERSYLRGYLAFVKSAEPEFLQALIRKYGEETIMRITNA
jgi:RNA-directed DNA polymerase